ncbi:PTS sugar transporter subunit IIB, partial [Enterococcus faecium]
MIKLLRVDERFVHGQVALAWTNNLGANCIFVASNEIATNN